MASSTDVFSFPVVSFRKLETPFTAGGHHDHYAIVDTRELPDLRGWRKINVRDPKLRGAVPNAIRVGFKDNPDLFVFMNRGLVISAADVRFDNKTNKVTVTLDDPRAHGLLDGGHTYNIVLEETENRDPNEDPVYVKLEFLTGFDHEDIPNVVDARNTSNQVKDESLMNLEGSFDPLKKILANQKYFHDIAWKEFEVDDNGDPKPIDVREIIAILMCFDRDNFDDTIHPINAYRSKAAALTHFKKNQASFRKLYGIADDLLRLHDEIYLALPQLYNKARKSTDVSGGKFGRLTGVTVYKEKGKKRADLLFANKGSIYGVPSGFVFPILGAFRALLVQDKKGNYVWAPSVDPFAQLNNGLGLKLANVLGNFALEDQNPSKTGKSPNVWQSCYSSARLHFLESQVTTKN